MRYEKEKLVDTGNFSFSHSYFNRLFPADTYGLFEKEFNGPEKEALKSMSNKSRLFLMIEFESKTNTVHSK